MKCLMIKTADRRRFFTHEKNLQPLQQFSKIFHAEISIVNVQEATVLDLEQLAPAFCNLTAIETQAQGVEIIEIQKPHYLRNRKKIRKTAENIKQFIREHFLSGEIVSLDLLRLTFDKANITTACLCNHLSTVRKELAQYHQIEKLGGGKYRKIN